VPVTYSFYYVPQFSVCYDFGAQGSPSLYYGGPLGPRSSGENPNAISCSSSSASVPYNTIYGPNTIGDVAETPCKPTGAGNAAVLAAGMGYCAGPGLNTVSGDLAEFAKQVVDQYLNYPVSGTGEEAISTYEIWNEPNDPDGSFFIQDGGSISPWTTFIKQTYYLENAINAEYSADSITASSPTYIGPGIVTDSLLGEYAALCGTAASCTSTNTGTTSTYGFLNTCISGFGCGYQLINEGSFHFYPSYYEAESRYMGACQNTDGLSNETAPSTSIECTGQNIVLGVGSVLGDFGAFDGITGAVMTEGSWAENCDLEQVSCTTSSSTPTYSDMQGFVARYTLLMATTTGGGLNVTQQHWFGWDGALVGPANWGTLCDSGAPTTAPPCYTQSGGNTYGGYAYGTVIGWLAGNEAVTQCTQGSSGPTPHACGDNDGSVWTINVTDSSGDHNVIAWTWDGSAVTCRAYGTDNPGCPDPISYMECKRLDGSTCTLGSTFVLGQNPVYFMKD